MAKKGQGALEFLMTYGWAFLVILIMIGALAYFGVLNPSRWLPDRCQFGTGTLCREGQYVVTADADHTIRAQLVNNGGSHISVYGWTATTDVAAAGACTTICFNDDAATANCGDAADVDLAAATILLPIAWDEGQGRELVVGCTTGNQLPAGTKVKFNVKYKYFVTTAGSTYTKDGSGEIYASVQ
jgi:hypothetical protein